MRFAGGKDVGGVVEIIIPLGGKQRRGSLLIPRMQENHVTAVLGGEMDMTIRERFADRFRDLLKNMFRRRIFNLVDGIKP